MSDDCIDFENDRDKAKKPVQSDFEQGVVTLPLINAFIKIPEFKDKAKSGKVTRNDINEAVSKSGGIQFTRKVSKMYYDKSMAIIGGLDITDDKKAKLKAILARASGIC
jgi:heptaprenyl diphosphate synthase